MRKLKNFWDQLHSDYRGYCYFNYDADNGIKYKDPIFLFWVIRELYFKIKQRYCHHEWIVESHISPDSGSEDVYCPKCGLSHHIIYY